MPRSVNAVASRARRKRILKATRGYFGRGSNVWTVAKNKYEKGLQYAYRDRKVKKREFRSLWIQRINAGARLHGFSYSQLMGLLKKDRKSTRLNSSHVRISYAVFCLKKKKNNNKVSDHVPK